ncbi:acetolactate decarboxylase [Weeksellaceae bacterium TAE3-ERU29]|nr:acetolactate decarboxylase [Weeksellaceae bacterium TAE3-ERU29]
MALFQHNTLGSIMVGNYDGTISIEKLLTKGNLGIGTYDKIDGELVVLDNVAYQVHSDGKIYKAKPKDTLPYASVANCENAIELEVPHKMESSQFYNWLKSQLISLNLFAMLRVDGVFTSVKTRVVKAQKKPYKPFKDAIEDQVIFEKKEMKGTLVGLYTPNLFGMISAQEFHSHIINDEKDFGGHLLKFSIIEGTVKLYTQDRLIQDLPTNNTDFLNNEIETKDILEDIKSTEK